MIASILRSRHCLNIFFNTTQYASVQAEILNFELKKKNFLAYSSLPTNTRNTTIYVWLKFHSSQMSIFLKACLLWMVAATAVAVVWDKELKKKKDFFSFLKKKLLRCCQRDCLKLSGTRVGIGWVVYTLL